jgi:hypothetical protein
MAFKPPKATILKPFEVATDATDDMVAIAELKNFNTTLDYAQIAEKIFVDLATDKSMNKSRAENQLEFFLLPSLEHIKNKWQKAFNKGGVSEKRANYNIKKKSEESITESFRQVFLDTMLMNGQNDAKLARMLSTDAEVPDFDHALLEGLILPLDTVLEAVKRFGCHHDFEVLN